MGGVFLITSSKLIIVNNLRDSAEMGSGKTTAPYTLWYCAKLVLPSEGPFFTPVAIRGSVMDGEKRVG